MKFAFIKRHEKEHCVGKMAELLGVTRNGYYSWKKRPESKRKQENEIIKKEIIQIFEASKKRYGYPRVHKVLVSKNIKCGINKVAKFMKENVLRAKAKRNTKLQRIQITAIKYMKIYWIGTLMLINRIRYGFQI